MNIYEQDPAAKLDYIFDWKPLSNARPGASSDYLDEGEDIESFDIIAEPGITVDSSSKDPNGFIKVWLKDGVLGEVPEVKCIISTDQGRIDSRRIAIRVREMS